MNLDIGILWIEDSFSTEEEQALVRRIQEAGFIARIEVEVNGENLGELAKRHALFHCFDIILLDYKLKNVDGDALAPRIRELFPSTTILFYSGNEDEDGLRQKIAINRVEGVYCSHRRRFIERAGALVDQTARSLDRLSGMRGLAMRVVSDCDVSMKEAVIQLSARDQECADKLTELDGDVIDHLDKQRTKYQEAILKGIEERIDTFAVDSAKLFRHFRRLTLVVVNNPARFDLTGEQTDHLREMRTRSAQYVENVLKKRNVLGHVREVESEAGWALEGGEDISAADFPEIRRSFAGHLSAIRSIAAIINAAKQ
jgi:CheY-like chemotaxis protein